MICAKSAHMINYIAKGLAVSANPVCYITNKNGAPKSPSQLK